MPLKKGKMKGANNPGKEFVGGEVTLKHIYEIAKIKLTVRSVNLSYKRKSQLS